VNEPLALSSLVLRGVPVERPLFLAPMAGITHSAFRLLVAGFGGYGALWTEMLPGPAILHENLRASPFTKRRDIEGRVVYQLLLDNAENVPKVIEKLKAVSPFGIDLNLGCPAPKIRLMQAGAALFRDYDRCGRVLSALRAAWDGPLFIKCRLGGSGGGWEEHFARMATLFENTGVDALTVHPRFSDEKLKRRARTGLYPWIASLSRVPIIANGDIVSAAYLEKNRGHLKACGGIMIGRMAAVKPWIFAELNGTCPHIDYLEVWRKFYGYVIGDFPQEKAIGRLKEFASYFARNFFFGHQMYRSTQSARSPDQANERAIGFLKTNPRTVVQPAVDGL
jgi:tRNA-dihydrouridine synthase B